MINNSEKFVGRQRLILMQRQCILALMMMICALAASASIGAQSQAEANSNNRRETATIKYLRGKLGTKYDVRVRLEFRGAGAVRGDYFYEKPDGFYIGALRDARVHLEGKIDADGRLTLYEIVRGKRLAVLRGRGEGIGADGVPYDARESSIAGVWSKIDNSNSLKFAWTESGFEFRDGARLIAQRRIESDAIDGVSYEIETSRPVMRGSDTPRREQVFNRFVQQRIADSITAFENDIKETAGDAQTRSVKTSSVKTGDVKTLTLDYETMLVNEDIASLRFERQAKIGALLERSFVSLNFNLKSQREIGLASLFKEKSGYEKTLDRICAEVFKGTDYALFPDDARLSVTGEAFTGYNLTPEHLVLNFKVPPALGGTVEVFIPYLELKGVINQVGILMRVID